MALNQDAQAMFMEAVNGLKEYAKVNGGFVNKEDIAGYFKGIELDDAKFQMIYGYLMANNIRIKDADMEDNSFLSMFEGSETEAMAQDNQSEENDNDTANVRNTSLISQEDYEEDEKHLQQYIKELENVETLSDTTRAFLLVNIVEDNDKESLRILTESYLEKIVGWIEPFKRKGVLSSDLIQEANLAMMAYMNEKKFTANYEWREKIKEGTTDDVIYVLGEIDKEVQSQAEEAVCMLLDEQNESDKVSDKVLGKVNLVNDWAKRLREELERKPTIDELAERIGVSRDVVEEAVKLSAANIEDINMGELKQE